MSYSRTWELVRVVNALDLPHRRGWKPSEKPHAIDVQADLEAETLELNRALTALIFAEGELARGVGSIEACEHAADAARKEVGDVFAVTLQAALRLKMDFPALDKHAAKKLRERFIGVPAVLP